MLEGNIAILCGHIGSKPISKNIIFFIDTHPFCLTLAQKKLNVLILLNMIIKFPRYFESTMNLIRRDL